MSDADQQPYWDSIKAQISVSAFIESLGGQFKRVGRRGWDQYHCPFVKGHVNGDEHASGSVSTDDQYYRCRACNVRGDIFDLVQYAGLANDFMGAVKWLEDNALNQGANTTDSW